MPKGSDGLAGLEVASEETDQSGDGGTHIAGDLDAELARDENDDGRHGAADAGRRNLRLWLQLSTSS